MVQIQDDLFVVRTIPGEYSRTLPAMLGMMLHEAESLYGLRDQTFSLLGIEIGQAEQPHTWFSASGKKHVVIRLGYAATDNRNEALFQLAHECIHLLNPVLEASVLEEGLATDFSLTYIQRIDASYHTKHSKYNAAHRLVHELLAKDTTSAIRRFRLKHQLSGFAARETGDRRDVPRFSKGLG